MNGHEYPLTRRVRWALFCANAPLGTPRSGRPSSQRYAVSWCCRSDGPLVSRPALSAFHWRKRQCGPTGRLGSKDGDAECRSRFAGDPDPLTVSLTIRTEYGGTQGYTCRTGCRQLQSFVLFCFTSLFPPSSFPQSHRALETPDTPHRTPQATDDNGQVASAGLWGTWGRSSPFLRFLHCRLQRSLSRVRQSRPPGKRRYAGASPVPGHSSLAVNQGMRPSN